MIVNQLQELIEDQAKWSQKTFGADEARGPIGGLKHLVKEAGEALAAWESGHAFEFRKELADCFLLLLDINRRSGSTFQGLVNDSLQKMELNKSREWPEAVDDEPVEHVRESDEGKHCAGCRFLKVNVGSPQFECRRRAPMVHEGVANSYGWNPLTGLYPLVNDPLREWCGEYEKA